MRAVHDNNELPARVERQAATTSDVAHKTIQLGEGDIKRGAQVMSTQMAADYTPPSTSLNPKATVAPRPAPSSAVDTAATAAAADAGTGSASSPNSGE
jgi:hypothetical protein